jgi:5'(3')-deoxyribonucleotidase
MAERNYTNPKRVYFDMDGVLADFEKESIERGIPFKVLKNTIDAYRHLPIMEGAKEAVSRFIEAGYELFILTKTPSKNPYSATEKIFWANEHFPEFGDHIMITPDKGALGQEGHILIDDHPEWANAHNFETRGGKVIHFTRDWNKVFEEAGI